MDPHNHGQPPFMGVLGGPAQNSYLMNQFQSDPVTGEPIGASSNVTQPGGLSAASSQLAQNQLAQNQLAFQHVHQQQQQQLQEQLQNFWATQRLEVEQVIDFKNHNLPLARIKKIMKADEDVRMISAEAPVLFSRACEMFILELTMRAWNHTEENKRRTLQRNDIAVAITRTEIFDFLVDIVPREDLKEEGASPLYKQEAVPPFFKPGSTAFEGPADGVPYYYMPPSQTPQLNTPGMSIGNPMMDQLSYAQPPHPYAVQQMWPQHQPPPLPPPPPPPPDSC